MSDESRTYTIELSRRSLLHGAACGIGVATVLGITVNAATAGKLPQKTIGYRPSPKGNQHCGNCRLFEPPNACKSVEGPISPQGWCMIYVRR
jgi:hypothetical protein